MIAWAHLAVNVILVIIYACYFGQHSVLKYADKGIIIIKKEVKDATVPQPGLNIIHAVKSYIHSSYSFQE